MKPSRNYLYFTRYAYKMRGAVVDDPLHCHPQYEILYIDQASCDYMIGDRVIRLQPGDLFIMNGLARHWPSNVTADSYIRTTLVFEPHLMQVFHPDMGMPDPLVPFKQLRNYHLRLSGESKQECEAILKKINTFYKKSDPVYESRFLMAFFDLLMFIYDQCRTPLGSSGNAFSVKELNVQKIIDYIEGCFMEDIRLEQIEAHLHMSKYHLTKIFHDITGMTIFDYLLNRRINQAKMLFMHGKDETVTNVGYQVGFKHLAHFSRAFKKRVGMSPEQYRKYVHGS